MKRRVYFLTNTYRSSFLIHGTLNCATHIFHEPESKYRHIFQVVQQLFYILYSVSPGCILYGNTEYTYHLLCILFMHLFIE